jgi:hypothetical protein
MHAIVEIVPHRSREFGLVARLFQHFRVDAVNAAEGAVVGRARYPAFGRRLAEAGDPAFESCLGKRGREKHAKPKHSRRSRAGKTPDAYRETHLFLLRESGRRFIAEGYESVYHVRCRERKYLKRLIRRTQKRDDVVGSREFRHENVVT